MTDRVIGQILVARSLVPAEKLELALEIQEEKGGELIDILVQQKVIAEEEVYRAVAAELDLPFHGSLNPADIDHNLVENLRIEYTKTQSVLPLRREDDRLVVATSHPLDAFILDDLRVHFGVPIEAVVVPPVPLLDAINKIYDKRGGLDVMKEVAEQQGGGGYADLESNIVDIIDATDEAPIIRLVNSTLYQAVKDRASDIHFEPFERHLSIRFRVDGVLREIVKPPKHLQAAILSRVKIMAGMNIAEKRLPQDGRIRIKIAGKDIDIRASTIPTAHGERAVLRLLERSSILLDLEDLGFAPDNLRNMEKLIRRPHGIILVTGPTGSGKTTTLYASLSKINSPDKNILTVEDPIEYQLPGIGQMQVNQKIELSFATGLRHFLRQDPDIIMVGEIRDVETAEIAIQASLTGHLVFSTIHTNDAAGAFTRLIDMGVEPFVVSSTLIASLAQRLIRVLCKQCREPYLPKEEELVEIGLNPSAVTPRLSEHPIYRATGCEACLGAGYSGRSGIYELLMVNDDIRTLVMQEADGGALKKSAMAAGMTSLRADGALKVLKGITTIEEVMRVTQDDEN